MNFLKSARSLIFKMLKNAGKSWKILFTLIIPRALNFSAFSRDLPVQVRSTGFFVVRGLFKFFLVNKQLVFRDLVLLSVCWTRVSHRGCWADGFSLSCWHRRRLCCSKRECESPESYLDKETGVFLSLMQGDETTIGYFHRMIEAKKKNAEDEDGGCMWLPLKSRCCGFVAIFHHGYSERVAGVIRLCHCYSFYSFNAEKFNSFYSIINEWPHWVDHNTMQQEYFVKYWDTDE